MEIKLNNAERLSHAYIISAADMTEALGTAKELAAAAVCQRGYEVPCRSCRACRKAFDGVHPDIITVERRKDDKGVEKREINVDQVREMAADAYVLPNEAERKVYIVKDADTMNPQAQNAALKLLEEPPKGVIFLLCVKNRDQLLVTVRSRCVEMNCGGTAESADEESEKRAKDYLKVAASADRAEICRWCTKNEDMSPSEALSFVACVEDFCADMIAGRRSRRDMSTEQIMYLSTLMHKCSDYLKVNVGVKHIFGILAVDTVRPGSRGK